MLQKNLYRCSVCIRFCHRHTFFIWGCLFKQLPIQDSNDVPSPPVLNSKQSHLNLKETLQFARSLGSLIVNFRVVQQHQGFQMLFCKYGKNSIFLQDEYATICNFAACVIANHGQVSFNFLHNKFRVLIFLNAIFSKKLLFTDQRIFGSSLGIFGITWYNLWQRIGYVDHWRWF